MTKPSRGMPVRLRAAYQAMVGRLAARPDVTGVDVGFRYKGGARKRQLTVRVHVVKKLSLRRLPVSHHIPTRLEGIPVDVIEATYRSHALASPGSGSGSSTLDRFDPICGGISVGNPKAGVGTLGAVVFDEETGAPCILSAFHVLAGAQAVDKDPATQPAPFDQGSITHDTIAHLYRSLLPGSSGDAAIAKLDGSRAFSLEQLSTRVHVKRAALPMIGQILEKSGRSTGVTRGRVVGMGKYFYAEAPLGISGFQMELEGHDDPVREDLSAPGDSGALWYDPATKTGVGVHAAGEVAQANEFAIASYLTRVLSALSVRLAP